MKKSEICLLLATALEPRPTYKPAMRIEGVAVDIDGQLSRLGFWVYSISQGSNVSRSWLDRYSCWMPVDFFTSAEAQMQVLEAMLLEFWSHDKKRPLWMGLVWIANIIKANHPKVDDLATAIIKAALCWKGIEGGIE